MTKNILLLSIAFLSFFGLFACKSKTVVKKLVNQNSSTSGSQTTRIDGVMYQLPKTVLQVTIPVKRSSQARGRFWNFAPCFFPTVPAKKIARKEDPEVEFSIDTPTFSSRGIPDKSETYVLETKGKYFESKTLFVEYAPGTYILQKGESEAKNETLDFTVKAVSTIAGIAAKAAPLAQLGGPTPDETEALRRELRKEMRCYNTMATLNITEGPVTITAPFNKPGTTSMAGKIDAYLTSNTPIVPTTDEQTLRDEYKTASEAFATLLDLQNQRDLILNGTNNNITDEALKLMFDRNAEAAAAYKGAFLGVESEKPWAATFEFTPVTDGDNSPLIFSYSKEKGVCLNGLIESKSIAVPPAFTNGKCAATPETTIQALWLSASKVADPDNFLGKIKGANDEAERHDRSRGWYYRVPADAEVFLQNSTRNCTPLGGGNFNCFTVSIPAGTPRLPAEQIAVNNMQIAQFGVVASVPSSSAGRSHTTSIGLDPATGAMKNFKVSSTALVDKSILDEAGKAANSAIDAADPLNRKKRELEDLKTQNQINEEKKKLSNSNTSTQDQP